MGWHISKQTTASFDIDAQKGFTPICPYELPVEGGDKIAVELNRQAKKAKYRIGSKDAHPDIPAWMTALPIGNGQPTKNLPYAPHHWVSHCVCGTEGFELLDGLPHPLEYDYFVWKGMEPDVHPYGACYHDPQGKRTTGVIEWLHEKRVENVICGGLATDYCVKTTVLQLSKAGFRVFLNEAASRGIDAITTIRATHEMEKAGVIFINNSLAIKNI